VEARGQPLLDHGPAGSDDGSLRLVAPLDTGRLDRGGASSGAGPGPGNTRGAAICDGISSTACWSASSPGGGSARGRDWP
ncbi:hypothetical protein ABZ504_56390, partial [Streptomyces mirabilis]|uniref:hypothetical protein n=1 Tax=Streptomyces mirabilis TaxID=68239 RepID=UPI0034020AD8